MLRSAEQELAATFCAPKPNPLGDLVGVRSAAMAAAQEPSDKNGSVSRAIMREGIELLLPTHGPCLWIKSR